MVVLVFVMAFIFAALSGLVLTDSGEAALQGGALSLVLAAWMVYGMREPEPLAEEAD